MVSKWDKEAIEVVEKMSQNEKERLYTIIAMNTMVKAMNDEDAYMSWIYLVPDCASEWDFIDFAVNDVEDVNGNHLFDEAAMLFKRLWKKYAMESKGLYIGDKCY